VNILIKLLALKGTLNNMLMNIIGLCINIIGVIVMFVFPAPPPKLEEGVGIGLEDGTYLPEIKMTVAEYNKLIEKRRKRHLILSRVGIGLIGLGFIFQLIASL